MTGAEIIESVMRQRQIGRKDFFGSTKLDHVVRARRAAMVKMHRAGLSISLIARLTKRDRTSVLYNLRPEMRANHKAYFAVYSANHRAPPRAGYMGKDKRRKLTTEQQDEILALYRAGRIAETHAMERQLRVCHGYAQKFIYRLERQKMPRPRTAVARTANSPLWARAIERGSISI